MGTEKRIIDIYVVRDKTVRIRFKVCPEIEAYYSELANGAIHTSQSWMRVIKGAENKAEFYAKATEEREPAIFREFHDNYGETLLRDGRPNIAILRTVGASKDYVSISVKGIYSEDALRFYAQEVKRFCICLYRQHIRKARLRCLVTFQEVE